MTKSSKKKSSSKSQSNNNKSKVSVLTCSQLKRIPFIHNLTKMINNQTFDIDEWVIVNGCSTDEDHDKFNEEIKLVETDKCDIIIASDKNLKYRNIGAFRNLANRNASGDIIVCMDDDDFYFPDYIKTCYEVLTQKKNIDVVGCSGMFMYDYGFDTVFRLASFGPNHTVNCCLAYRRDYFNSHKYDETRVTGEKIPV